MVCGEIDGSGAVKGTLLTGATMDRLADSFRAATLYGTAVLQYGTCSDRRMKCDYCGRRQEPEKHGGCVSCGAPLP